MSDLGSVSDQPVSASVTLVHPSRARFAVLALLAVAVTINYLDRAIVGIAAPSFKSEFHLDAATLGLMFSAFSWSYFAAQVPVGIMLDRLGPRIIYALALAGWSFFTLLQAFAGGIGALIGFRLGLGLSEAPCFPANSSIVGMWFPRRERARAIGIYTAAEYIGLGFLSPVLFWILKAFGWRSLFVLTGSLGLLFALVWWIKYRDPDQSKTANRAELAMIAVDGGIAAYGKHLIKFEWRHIAELFRHRQIWGLCIGQFSVYSTFVFFLTWFPTYLASARHMGWIKVGFFTSLPYIAGFFGILFAGWWSDYMLKRGCSLNLARKLPVITGLLVASTIILANYVSNNVVVICILSAAFFAQAMSSSGWAVISEVAPIGMMGLVGGLFSAAANLSGIVTPLVIGFMVRATGSFTGPLAFVGIVAAIGAFSWIFVIGDIRRVEIANGRSRTAG